MRRLFDYWPQISSRIRSAGSVALFLDFDGTLTPIRATPDEVQLSQPTRLAIARLAGNPRARVWVISGRRRADVRNKTAVAGVQYLGLHGWEGRLETPLSAETRRAIQDAKRTLVSDVEPLRGIWVEDKGPTFALHYRGATDDESKLASASVREVMARLDGGFRLLHGKKVSEILPRELGNKGSAVRRELTRIDNRALPIYIGDDLTDESAFSALPQGLTIRVGQRSVTRAQFQLFDPGDVRRFLGKLEFELS